MKIDKKLRVHDIYLIALGIVSVGTIEWILFSMNEISLAMDFGLSIAAVVVIAVVFNWIFAG